MNRLFLFMTILVLGVPVYAQSEKRIDTKEKQENVNSRELKKQLAEAKPYRTWLSTNRIELDELKSGRKVPHHVENYDCMLRTFGYSKEDIEKLIMPMASIRSRK